MKRATIFMKTIIAGTRTLTMFQLDELVTAIDLSGFKITEVVSGAAPGGDFLGEQYAMHLGLPVKKFPAAWDDLDAPGAVIRRNRHGEKYNVRAGVDRNLAMAEYAEALIALWDGKSTGTADMILQAHRHGLRVYVYLVK